MPGSARSLLIATLIERTDQLTAVRHLLNSLDPAEHATTSRDFGRGFAHALRLVRETLGER